MQAAEWCWTLAMPDRTPGTQGLTLAM